jgi:hypothetical protein
MSELSATQSPWRFACRWYDAEQIHATILSQRRSSSGRYGDIPTDVHSRAFAEWLTNQYRLAMCKGIEIAKRELEEVE